MTIGVLVVGSANLDVVVGVERLPHAGETLMGKDVVYLPGGKGLNQAIAAASTGTFTAFLGAVGTDDAGRVLRLALQEANVDTTHLLETPRQVSGSAHILVADSGANHIVVVPGANGAVDADQLEHFRQRRAVLSQVNVLILQGEIPMQTNIAAATIAYELGVRTVLNLAPATKVKRHLLEMADPLIVNEFEAGLLLDLATPTDVSEAISYARILAETAQSVVITLGSEGSVVVDNQTCTHIPAASVPSVIDTTGAGDAFVGVLGAEIARGSQLCDAARKATECAGTTVQLQGASSSYSAIRALY